MPVELTLEEAYQGVTRSLQLASAEPCPTCGGSGQVAGALCHICQGQGVVAKPRRIEAKIPAGVHDGSRVHIGGGGLGDVYLRVAVRPHPRFERRGADLHTEVSVPLLDAVLGGEARVKTLKGEVALTIPPPDPERKGVPTGRAWGCPISTAAARGNLYAKVKVVAAGEAVGARGKAIQGAEVIQLLG